MKYNFLTQLRVGKVITKVIEMELLLSDEVKMVLNREEDPAFRELGVDLEVKWANGKKSFIEVKADTMCHSTGNVFCEVVSVDTSGTPGCFVTSKADVWAYVVPGNDTVLWLPLKRVRKWVLAHEEDFRRVRVPNQGGYASEGLLVPLKKLLAADVGVRVDKGLLERVSGQILGLGAR